MADQSPKTTPDPVSPVVAGLGSSHGVRPEVSSTAGDLSVEDTAGSGDPRRAEAGEPVVVAAGVCRVTARRRFCWPVSTSHELAAGKAYRLQILMQRQPPEGMVEILAGRFLMGDPTEEGDSDERSQHPVHVSAFFIVKHQVTLAQWRETYDWAIRHGYQLENRGRGLGDEHPVYSVIWYDVVKWCNAPSEREGRMPAYFIDRIGGNPYRQGRFGLPANGVNWYGEGYRLPTEAEWKEAARGGLEGHHYPWESNGVGQEHGIPTAIDSENIFLPQFSCPHLPCSFNGMHARRACARFPYGRSRVLAG